MYIAVNPYMVHMTVYNHTLPEKSTIFACMLGFMKDLMLVYMYMQYKNYTL